MAVMMRQKKKKKRKYAHNITIKELLFMNFQYYDKFILNVFSRRLILKCIKY